jgi:hypothetical protein
LKFSLLFVFISKSFPSYTSFEHPRMSAVPGGVIRLVLAGVASAAIADEAPPGQVVIAEHYGAQAIALIRWLVCTLCQGPMELHPSWLGCCGPGEGKKKTK